MMKMNSQEFQNKKLKTAVLFLVFNRPDTTRQVFEAIRRAKPPRLYIAADGPREGKLGEVERVEEVRTIATTVDWPCEVKTLFRDKNIGCEKAGSSAITWFFEQEEQGIILEDDCLPHQDFFKFCETLLNYYSDNERVSMITGINFQAGQKRGTGSYYFSQYNHVWGWASWRRAWKYYDINMSFWPTWKLSADWHKKFPDFFERRYWERTFDRKFANQIVEAWDFPWDASVWRYGGLTAVPNVNLVSNIGFGHNATHTFSVNHPLAKIPTETLGEIIHPKIIVQDQVADRFVFNKIYLGRLRIFPFNLVVLAYRLVKKIINRNVS
jgi:hypothetical protein